MIRNLLFSLGLIVALNVNATEDKNKISSTKLIIKDSITKELLPGVAVKIDHSKETFYTDLNGEVTLSAIKGLKYNVSINYIGYASENISLEGGTEKINIDLKP